MVDNPIADVLLFLGILMILVGLFGGLKAWLATHNNGGYDMKDYSTVRELAKYNGVPYTVIHGWIRRGYVQAIRGTPGDWRVSGAKGMLCHHTVAHNIDVSSLASLWRKENAVPNYLTASQHNRYNKKRKGNAV
jgi:hypothetical protein